MRLGVSQRPAMSAERWLAAYLLAVASLGAINSPALLAAALVLALAVSGPDRWRLLRRSACAALAFSATVSVAFAGFTLWQSGYSPALPSYLLLINLRVLLLVFLGFWFIARVDLRDALARWPTLAMVATLAAGQARVFVRALRDFRLAFRSRNPRPAHWTDAGRHAAAQAAYLLDKTEAASARCALAMRSRGCFDD